MNISDVVWTSFAKQVYVIATRGSAKGDVPIERPQKLLSCAIQYERRCLSGGSSFLASRGVFRFQKGRFDWEGK